MDQHIPFLRSLFDYDSVTGVITYRKKRGRARRGSVAGYSDTNGYICIKVVIDGIRLTFLAHRLGWALHHGKFPNFDLDHRDDVRFHNWIDNLRELSTARNVARSKRQKRSSTLNLPRGVVWAGHTNKTNPYMGQFTSGKTRVSKNFDTPEKASEFYREAFKTVHGCYPEEV